MARRAQRTPSTVMVLCAAAATAGLLGGCTSKPAAAVKTTTTAANEPYWFAPCSDANLVQSSIQVYLDGQTSTITQARDLYQESYAMYQDAQATVDNSSNTTMWNDLADTSADVSVALTGHGVNGIHVGSWTTTNLDRAEGNVGKAMTDCRSAGWTG